MGDAANQVASELPVEITTAMEAAGIPPLMSKLKEIIADHRRAKEAGAKHVAEPIEEMWPMMRLLPVDVDYQKALRAAKSGQLEATKVGGRWFCTKRAMDVWLAKTGKGKR